MIELYFAPTANGLRAAVALEETGLPYRTHKVDLAKGEVPVYVEVLSAQRERLLAHLARHDIDARPFYPDLDRAAYFNNQGDFPNSRQYGNEGIYLPSGPAQPMENIERVIKALETFTV